MSETDALSKFDFSKVTKPGLFIKFEAGKPLTLRILTVDPMVTTVTFEDEKTGEENLQTKFAFIVYNFTDSKAQILSATPNMAKKIGELHTDPDFGEDIRKIDIKISPTGEKLSRKYDIQVLPKTNELTNEQIKECVAIKLEDKVSDGQRMSFYKPEEKVIQVDDEEKHTPGVADATKEDEVVIEDIGDEPINLDDIPF